MCLALEGDADVLETQGHEAWLRRVVDSHLVRGFAVWASGNRHNAVVRNSRVWPGVVQGVR